MFATVDYGKSSLAVAKKTDSSRTGEVWKISVSSGKLKLLILE